ncbi:MAG: diguanylate cyclase [Spirochaetales bacterium]
MSPLLLYSSALVASIVLSFGVAAMAFFRRRAPGGLAFTFVNLAGVFYAWGSLLEITSGSPEQALSALTLEYVGIATIGPLLFLTSVSATRGARAISTFGVTLLFIVPVLTILLVASNAFHHLFYTSIALTQRGPFSVPTLEKGPFWMLNMVYMNVCLFGSTLVAWQASRKGAKTQKSALRLLLVASLLPWSGMVWYQMGLSPWGLDTAPFGISLSAVFFAVALFRFGLFDHMPLVLDQVFENMREGVLVVDTQGRLAGLNPAMTRIVPKLSTDLVGTPVAALARLEPTLARFVSAGVEEEAVWRQEGEEPRVFQVDRSPLKDARGRKTGDIYLLADITQREELSQRLSHLARTDELTSLPNRRAFLERLKDEAERIKRYGGTFSLAIADIDHFKRVNDSWGHDAGDAVLAHVTRLWSSCLRTSDQLARWGGEEFTVLMVGTSSAEALVLLERMRSHIEANPLEWNGEPIAVTASFGVTSALGIGQVKVDRPEDWVHRADQALYLAKENGRNQVWVDRSVPED